MGGRIDGAVRFGRAVFREVREEQITFIAGSIAYSAFVSLLPLLLLLLVVLSAVGNDTLSQNVVALTESFLAPGAQGTLATALRSASGRAGASLVGAVTLLWGALKIFRGLDEAFSAIFESSAEDTFVDKLRDGVIVLGALVLAIGAAVVAGATFAAFPALDALAFLNPVLLVVGLMVALFPIYYVFPDADLSVREVLPGVAVAAVGWAALEALFQVYASFADKSDVYGVVGGFLLLITWLYFSGLVLLLGGVVNAVVAGYAGEDDVAAPRTIETRAGTEEAGGQAEADRTDASATRTAGEDGATQASSAISGSLERRNRDLRRERDDLRRENARMRREREALEAENAALRRRLDWFDLPAWQRAALLVLGWRPEAEPYAPE